MATVVIQYPVGHDFDVDYYVNTHMPLAHKIWGPQGLVSGQVIKLGGDSPYQIYTIITWDSLASFQKASVSEEAKQIRDDVKNFTTATPTVVIGETVAKA
ncbi:dimeric alpha-beta barrel [Fusarium globosum]|uniref:Dimeric alpha-beta barrel n=1 Tax=Fusarium globosum TaxID=78864 RepID=A0A8H5XY30_9HYPO|nr:dimeric alpha-beta barrel [Fusarium globosum]